MTSGFTAAPASPVETLIASVLSACQHREATAWRLETITRGATAPTLLATDEARVVALTPSLETAAYLYSLDPVATAALTGPLRRDLDALPLPTPAEFARTADLARAAASTGRIARWFRGPVEGDRALEWMRSLDVDALHQAYSGIDARLGSTDRNEWVYLDIDRHRPAVAADLRRTTGADVHWVDAATVDAHADAVAALTRALATADRLESDVATALRTVTARQAEAEIARTDISVLDTVTGSRLRLGALRGLTLRQIADARPEDLERIDGVGEKTATQSVAAARAYIRDVENSQTPVIDYRDKGPSTPYVLALARLLTFRDALGDAPEVPLHIPRVPEGTAVAVAETVRWLGPDDVPTLPDVDAMTAEDAWNLYAVRAADFHAWAGGGVTGGDVPAEVAERIAGITLRGTLHASLRGYQAFGAKFILAQRKALIGDEMGLGKTLQALAVIVHLAATPEATGDDGRLHALVVCPPSLRINWRREIERFTDLDCHVIHGADRDAAFHAWRQGGGVAVVGFPEIRDNPRYTDPEEPADILVVDEAHRAKNSRSQQSQAVQAMTALSPYVAYLTGTPLENRVDEFVTLLTALDPGLTLDTVRAEGFRTAIAGVYLRRNQDEVLDELPPLVDVEEWVDPTPEDRERYRDAVARGHFADMRQAASAPGSAKMERLQELLDDGADAGKTIVFSFFRSVVDALPGMLGDRAFGPVAGGVSHADRQQAVDDFTAADPGAVLVCQITAAAEGLNIQAANRVVIVEPQLNPAVEAQAVARAHRMGQIRTVEVHRLLTPDSVDERLVELLAEKRAQFDLFARDSAAADAAPEAVDVSEARLIEQVIAEERRRLGEPPRL
ncbi:DEAD/DEAH box helicase [Corynebacterium bovis]|uniref:DEAD/DEAH box helicase n=1 Tax=Corynebacterium bovis TaxID=36808 RepID=UPI003139B982